MQTPDIKSFTHMITKRSSDVTTTLLSSMPPTSCQNKRPSRAEIYSSVANKFKRMATNDISYASNWSERIAD